jgi:hypothetical protein
MSVFISHVEENRQTAEAIARGLESEGYQAWSYETSSVPGPTYLSQVVEAIEAASAMILLISPEALGSHQVAREIEAGHELDLPIIPVLLGITHEKYLQRRPEWRLALGAYTSIEVPRAGVDAIMPKIVGGLEALGVARGATAPPPRAPAPSATGIRRVVAAARHRPWSFVILAACALVVVAGAALLLSSGDDEPAVAPSPSGSQSTFPDVPAGSIQLEGTVEVEPTTVDRSETVKISYSITNTSDQDLEAATTEIVVLLGAQWDQGESLILGDISQDIAAGATVEGSIIGDPLAAKPGPQKVSVVAGQRIPSGSGTINSQLVAETPITIE